MPSPLRAIPFWLKLALLGFSLSSLTCYFLILDSEVVVHIYPLALKTWSRQPYQLIRHDLKARQVVGFRFEGQRVVTEQWSEDTDAPISRPVDLPNIDPGADFSFTTDPAGHRLFAVANSNLAVLEQDSHPRLHPLTHNAPVDSLSWMPDGSLAITFHDGFLQHWDPRSEKIRTEKILSPEPNSKTVLIAGERALIRGATLLYRGETFILPGRIRAVEPIGSTAVIVGGDFEGIMMLTHGHEPTRVTAGEVSALSWNGSDLLASGLGGVRLFNVNIEHKVHLNLRQIAFQSKNTLSVLIVAAAILGVLCAALIAKAVQMWLVGLRQRRDQRVPIPANTGLPFPPPPEELVEAISAGDAVLWAGSGLSAQAYCPTRHEFVGTWLDLAAAEQWLHPQVLVRARNRWQSGLSEDVADLIVRSKPDERFRLTEVAHNAYTAPLLLNAACYSLARMPWAGVITTNYDCIFERLTGSQTAGALDDETPLELARKGAFFILKLFGDTSRSTTTLLTTSELRTALERSVEWRDQLREIARSKTILFLGCSAEYLLADLHLLGIGPPVSSFHYALVAVSGEDWKEAAFELEKSHGVRVVPIPESDIGTVMPAWIDILAKQACQHHSAV